MDGYIWPWSNRFEPEFCNFDESELDAVIAVDAHAPQGDSIYSVSGICGNIWEWTTTLWGSERYAHDFVYPYKLGDGRDNQQGEDKYYRIIHVFSLHNLVMRVVVAPH